MTGMQAGSAAWTADALAKGLGRVVLRARSRRALDHAEMVVESCVHNHCYDADVEGTRAVWMLMLLDGAGATRHVSRRICVAADAAREPRDLRQARHMLALLARRGDGAARDQWRQLVLRSCAAAAEHEPPLAVTARGAVPSVSAHGPVSSVSAHGPPSGGAEQDWTGLPAAAVVARVRESGDVLPWPWCKAASVDALQAVAQAILSAPEHPQVQQFANLLSAFGIAQRPELLPPLVGLSRLPGRMGYRAFRTLARYSHPTVRGLAEERIAAGLADWRTLALLVRNFEPGDYAHVRRLLHAMQHENSCELHWFYSEITSLFEQHPHAEATDLLLRTYEDGPCALCRKHCVEGLLRLERLPEALARECAVDSLDDTRALFMRS